MIYHLNLARDRHIFVNQLCAVRRMSAVAVFIVRAARHHALIA